MQHGIQLLFVVYVCIYLYSCQTMGIDIINKFRQQWLEKTGSLTIPCELHHINTLFESWFEDSLSLFNFPSLSCLCVGVGRVLVCPSLLQTTYKVSPQLWKRRMSTAVQRRVRASQRHSHRYQNSLQLVDSLHSQIITLINTFSLQLAAPPTKRLRSARMR